MKNRKQYPNNWREISLRIKNNAGWKCERCSHPHDLAANRVLTVHHLDGDKSNCADWNLAALCQVCHLQIQGRVKMDQLFFLEILPVSGWFKPHYAGYLASKELKEPESQPLEKPIPLKEWLGEEAQRAGISPHGVYARLVRGQYPTVVLRKENTRTIWVIAL